MILFQSFKKSHASSRHDFFFACVFILFTLSFAGCASAPPPIPENLEIPVTTQTSEEWAATKLATLPFTLKIHEYDRKKVARIVQLNVLGFLYKSDYSVHDTPDALIQCRKFLKKYRKTLARAEKKYGVSKESITALLWVETKLGRYTGTYPLIQVYHSLLQADHPELVQSTLTELMRLKPDADTTLRKKAVDRSKTKAAWALTQLKSIQDIHSQKGKWIAGLKASYAGAFGLPQFIPLSYLQYAESATPPSFPNLNRPIDAILSVGHYLHEKGWKQDLETEKAKALYEYNHSKDYGAVILTIAKKISDSL